MLLSLEPRPTTGRGIGSWFLWLSNLNPFQSSYWALYTTLDDTQSIILLVLGLLSAVAAGVPLPLIAVTFRSIIESFPPDENALDNAIYRIIGIAFAYFVVTFTWTIVWGELGRRVSQRLQIRLVDKVLRLDQVFFDVDPLDITSMLVADTQTIQRGTSEKVGLFVQSCSYFVATFITGFVLNAALTGVLFAAIVPVIILITWTGSSLISKYSVKASQYLDQAASLAEGAIRCALVVQAFDVANSLADKHALLLKSAARYAVRKVLVSTMMLALVYWACYSLNALAFYWGSRLGGSSGTIYAVVFLILDASFVFNQVGPFIQTIALAAGASSKVFALLDGKDNASSVCIDSGLQLSCHDCAHDIVFDEVAFCYPARPSLTVLDSVSFTIPGRKATAVVGLSGSGKSTLACLLIRLYDPEHGSISIGGVNIRDFNLKILRSHIAIVQQNPVIFSGTIFDNIRCGIVDESDLTAEEVRLRCVQAAEDAHCDFIQSLEDGIDTVVSSSQGLSGGQRQRICLARALVRKPTLLILDEPTSALDSWSEQKIEESLQKIMQNADTTIITIAHRLATVRNYANILVMGDGQVLEQGTHDDLLENGTHYKALVGAQKIEDDVVQDATEVHSTTEKPHESMSFSNSAETSLETIVDQQVDSKSQPSPPISPAVSDRQLLWYCFQFLRPERAFLFVGVSAAIIQGAIVVGEAIVFGHMVSVLNEVSVRNILYDRVDFLSLMFFVISLVAFSATLINGVCFGFVSESFVLRMRDILLRTILVQDQSWFQESGHTTDKLIAGINQNSSNLAAVSGPILQAIFATSSMIISGMILSLVSTPLITIVVLSYLPAIMLSGYIRVKMLSLFEKRYLLSNKDAAAIACEAVQNIQTVAAYSLENSLLQKYDMTLKASYRTNFYIMSVGNVALSFSYSVIYFLFPLLYWWGSRQVRSGRYSQQEFFVSLPAVVIASQQCGQLFTLAPEVTSARSAARQVFSLLRNESSMISQESNSSPLEEVLANTQKVLAVPTPLLPKNYAPDNQISLASPSTHSSTATTPIREKTGAEIIFRDVTFSYPTRPDAKVLQCINLQIQPGQFVAFVGPSGAGKSSLVALLERFFDPLIGQVLLDGQDIRSAPVTAHRSKIGLVPQEPELFAGSVSFNISLGAKGDEIATQAQIEEVCKACGIHDFISSLPDGYETECGSQGSNLSGGQKQRIAVARALIRDPQVLLLDEATASLDSHSEKDIQNAVNSARTNRTTIVVAHRLSTIQHADCIFVLDNGILVDKGTHAELVHKDGIYRSMVQAQGLT